MPTSPRLSIRWFALPLTLLGLASFVTGAEMPLRQRIDTEVRAVWQREKLAPAGRCDDATFVRRIYLDLLGAIPSYEEAKQFLAASGPEKRARLIDRLLADPRFAAHQADVWDLLLLGRHPNLEQSRKRQDFKAWLASKFAQNEPYDHWVRELLLAEKAGTELYYVQYRNQPEEATVAISRTFLGTQLQCARCHDHPYESWTQRDFFGMAGFFVRLVVVEGGAKNPPRIGEKNTGEVLFTGSVKEQRPGQKGEPVKAKFLGGMELAEPAVPKGFKEPPLKPNTAPPRPAFSRKEKLAAWLTAPENPYFARAVANRLWAQFLGRGLVHPVDDLSEKNAPSHPVLLTALTQQLLTTKFDLKNFIRELVNSETYQLAGSGPNTDALPDWFERARVRPLSAEELLTSLRVATQFPADGFKGGGDPKVYFLRYFGEPTDGLGRFQGSLAEHLFLNNSPQIRTMVQPRKGNLADTLVTENAPWDAKVERLFLSVLSRAPSAAEKQRFVQHLSGNPATAPLLVEEAVWTLLSCSEFRFNH
jgi:hypothetical protein